MAKRVSWLWICYHGNNCCLKYLDGSVLEGRVITVEKARRRRGGTPTPGRYLGARTFHCKSNLDAGLPVILHMIEADTDHQAILVREIDLTPPTIGARHRSYSRSRSPYNMRDSDSSVSRRRSYSSDSSPYSPVRRCYYRSDSQSISPRVRRCSRSVSPRGRNRSYSRSISPRPVRRTSRRRYSRSYPPKPKHSRIEELFQELLSQAKTFRKERSYSRSYSPRMRPSKRSRSPSASFTQKAQEQQEELPGKLFP